MTDVVLQKQPPVTKTRIQIRKTSGTDTEGEMGNE